MNYIATRDGVEKYEMSYGNRPATKKQKELIQNLISDYPSSVTMFEYEDYVKESTKKNASELISSIMDQNIYDVATKENYDVATKENYVDYIANRPRVERLGEHGLFTDEGVDFVLNDIVKEVGAHEGNVWTHIISLKREDADRLGYDQASSWIQLCRAKRNELAEAMRINPNELKWFAAFHQESYHPHIHMVAYSTDPKKGYVSKDGINQIRQMFAKDIFHQDLMQLYTKQTENRDILKKYSQQIVNKVLKHMQKQTIYHNQIIMQKVLNLKESLSSYTGRIMYAYIPNDAKQIIHDILREMEKEPLIKKLYEQWQLYKQDIHETYSDKIIDKLPLFEQREFKSIKNMILKEVVQFDINTITYNEGAEQMDITIEDNTHYDSDCLTETEYTEKGKSKAYCMEWNDVYKKALQLFYGTSSIKQDIPEAKELLLKEYEQRNILGIELLAKIYEVEKDEGKNKDDIHALYREVLDGANDILDEDDDTFIQNYLHYKIGKLYFYGKGMEKNDEVAFNHYKQSNTQYANYALAMMYQRGCYVEKSDEKAFYHLEQSSRKGNAFADYELAKYYEKGIFNQKDEEKANFYYRKSYTKFESMVLKKEDDNLLYRLGEMSFRGKGVELNVEEAKKYLEKSSTFENVNAKILLSQIYLQEWDFPNIPLAIKWLEEANTPHAHYILGKEYSNGDKLEQDYSKAIYHFTTSAEENNDCAMYQLAKIYLKEEYHNTELAMHYLKKSSDLNNTYAQVMLGSILLKQNNSEEAFPLLMRAANQHNEFAQYIVGKLLLFGKDIGQDKEKAIMYLKLSAEQGNIYAQYFLDHMDDYQSQPLVLLTTRFFHHVSRMFNETLPHDEFSIKGIDKKLASKLKQKKIAQGHNPNDYSIRVQ